MPLSPAVPDGVPPSWTDRDDQLGAGFSDVRCEGCGTCVRVRKMNPAQTSTQWSAGSGCPYLVTDEFGRPAEKCPVLAAAIAEAVESGRLPTGSV